MSAPDAAAGSSGARQEADAPEPPQRRWVALVTNLRLLAAESERGRAMANDATTTAELDLDDAPRPSYLVLHPRIAALDPAADEFDYHPSADILAADTSGGLLFRVTKLRSDGTANEEETMYLCSTRAHKAITFPAVHYSDLGVETQPLRSVGLIADPLQPGGHYVVAQLCPRPPAPDDKVLCFSTERFLKPLHHLVAKLGPRPPSSAFRGDNLLCFSTATPGWSVKQLHTTTAVRVRNLCGAIRVLAHGGRLYWPNLTYGIFFCDPFAEPSHLRFVPLPDGCQVWQEGEHSEINRLNSALRRRVAPSEGHLRYVEIHGLSYDLALGEPPAQPMNPSVRMWTLVDPEAEEPWRFEAELEAHFAELWQRPSYVNFGLPYMEVPHVALVDPDNHHVVYFHQGSLQLSQMHLGSKLYGLDLRTREVVSCQDCPVPVGDIINAREWLPPTPSSPGENGQRDRWVIEHFDSWLDRMEVVSDDGPLSSSE